jgi:GNAT superfamily N-acetyltransferase
VLGHGIAEGSTPGLVRPLRDDDLPRLTDLVRGLLPWMVITERGLAHMRSSTGWWVADHEGEILGTGRSGRFGRIWVGVARGSRNNGIGTALLTRVEAEAREAGWTEATAWSDDDIGASFAARHGYHAAREKPVSVLELGDASLPPLEPPAGVELRPLVLLDDRLHELHELAMAAHRDDPADGSDAEQSFEEWLRDDIGVPDLDFSGSVVALVDGRLAALALVTTDNAERAENEFTGTHPDFRGRGLGTLVKLSTLHWARGCGIRSILTGNDAENAPMLAINRKLGYRQVGLRRKHVRAL